MMRAPRISRCEAPSSHQIENTKELDESSTAGSGSGLATLPPAMSPVLPQQVRAADIAPGEAGADGGAGPDGAGPDWVRHGVARAVEARDDAAVGPQHLALLVGACA